ncbi:MAG TPA: hypothetical protein VN613_07655 [Gemmatimonadaceae bacterium]|nr:hypothetical protein [Gemmatimonadaceae bacterium]
MPRVKASVSDDVVLLREYAALAGVSRLSAYIWARSGEIPARLVAGRYQIDRRDLARALQIAAGRRRPVPSRMAS